MNICRRLLICIALFAPLFISCGGDDDTEPNCNGPLCPFVGNWRLHELATDGSGVSGDHSSYRLNLKAPEADASSADYQRTFIDGQSDQGEWRLSNNADVLILSTSNTEEEYIVESVESARLVLVLNREGHKPGPSQIRYVFQK